MASISRRAAAIATATVLPLVMAVELLAPGGILRWLAPAWGLLAIVVQWLGARSMSRRARDLITYANHMPGAAFRPHLHYDDELGELATALSRMAPQMEQAIQGLSTELARREAILASMSDAVLAVDAKLNVSFCNKAFVDVVGHRITEGIPLIKVFRDPGLFQILQRVIDSGERIRQNLNLPVQAERWFEVHAAPLAGKTPHGALAILHDITPMARMERAQRDFVANVSHEFRTPLATITGCAETLLDGAWKDEANGRKFLGIIQSNSVRLTHIAADLITLSQLDTGQPYSAAAPVMVGEVICSAARAVEPVAAVRGIEIRVGEICPAQILGHRLAFEQALVNLLDNAIKFNRVKGEVVVRAVEAGDHVEISISDTGIGIPTEAMSRIFERFYRVDKARSRDIGGTGLGLSIVKQAVDRMNGTIRVESELGKGSCFTITLPLSKPIGNS